MARSDAARHPRQDAVIELHGADGLRRRCKPSPLLAEPRTGGEFAVLVDPGGKCRGDNGEAVTAFQFGRGLRQCVAEIVESDAVENGGERISLVAQRRRRRREHAPAGAALPELHGFEFLAARALADQLDAAAMRTALRPLGGMRNTGGGASAPL